MGSESNIYNMKLANSEQNQNLKPHNSDSEILKLSDGRIENVRFTLGEEEQQLVRISINNDDEVTCSTCLDQNVKRICSEINDFCSNSSKKSYESNSIDIAKYMERKASIEIENIDVSCESCDKNRSGHCDIECANSVRDVIVIPSAEAILDTGQDLKIEHES